MALVRSTLYERARQMADAVGATGDWPPALLAVIADAVLDNEWAQLLKSAPWLRTGTRTIALDADGSAPVADLDVGTGDTRERLLHVVEVRVGGQEFVGVRPNRATTLEGPGGYTGARRWLIDGGRFYALGARNQTATVRVTHLPQLVSELASDDSPIVFPEGGTLLLAYEMAAHMLNKGAREAQEAGALQAQAEVLRQKLHDRLLQQHAGPIYIEAPDDAAEWGG